MRRPIVELNPFGLKPFLYTIEEGERHSTLCRGFPPSSATFLLSFVLLLSLSSVSFPITVPFISASLPFLISYRAYLGVGQWEFVLLPGRMTSMTLCDMRLYVLQALYAVQP